MRRMGLDLSTKPGIAVADVQDGIEDPVLVANERFEMARSGEFPYAALDMAEKVADLVAQWYLNHVPDEVIIEQTNKGKKSSRYSQKQLEFIHAAVLQRLRVLGAAEKIRFIDTSEWRRLLGQHLTKDDKKNNAKVRKAKQADDFFAAKKALGVKGKIGTKHLAVRWVNEHYKLGLKMKDNDMADAICVIAAAGKPGVSFCDGN